MINVIFYFNDNDLYYWKYNSTDDIRYAAEIYHKINKILVIIYE